eukprot:CAMPEP_0115057674 /NCGR_PEP_ID=MMETSP0227-20121206/5899_1 /TAXON_ID=89957 /ORGANISM="Polarella glacialis, Strain CCMP 1383" /LENGTH=106 /DNA_ID=CAMNT_0002442523 /DNA_START=5 /DNA_END=321 /DNA_ORIENTATION=+
MAGLDQLIKDNKLDDEAIKVLRDMEADDQRRVLSSGPLNVFTDAVEMFHFRVSESKERELEEAEKRGIPQMFDRTASDNEILQWCESNAKFLDEAAIQELTDMSAG